MWHHLQNITMAALLWLTHVPHSWCSPHMIGYNNIRTLPNGSSCLYPSWVTRSNNVSHTHCSDFSSSVCNLQGMHGATCHTMGDHNIHTLLHDVFDRSYLYSEGKFSINIIYECCHLVLLCCILCLMIISSASMHMSFRTHPVTMATMFKGWFCCLSRHLTENTVTMVTMTTRVRQTHTKSVTHA